MCPIFDQISLHLKYFSSCCVEERVFPQDHLLGSKFWRRVIFNKSFDGISMILKYFSSVRTLFKACLDHLNFYGGYKLYHAGYLNVNQSRNIFRSFWVWYYLHEKNIFQFGFMHLKSISTFFRPIFYALCVCFMITSQSTCCLLLRNHSYWIVAVKCKRY